MGEPARKSDGWLTPAEVAAILKIPKSTVVYLCRKGDPCFRGAAKRPRFGWRVPVAALERPKRVLSYSEDIAQVAERAAQWKADGRYDDPAPPPKVEIVYVIRAGVGRTVKIGTTKDIKQRVASLQIGNPDTVRCIVTTLGGKSVEAELHERFRHLLVRGEWFRYGPEIREFVREQKRLRKKEKT